LAGVLVGLALLVSGGLLGAVQYAALAEYEPTTGTVEHARIDVVSNDTFGSNISLDGAPDGRLYEPNVTYSYTVDGETYTGMNVASRTGMTMSDRDKLAAILTPISPGGQTVYYDPANPGDAHLLQHLDFFPAGVLMLFGVLVVADAITPRARLVRLVTAWVPLASLERLPGVTPPADTVDDPMAILTAKRAWDGVDAAPFRGRASDAIWVFCLLLIVDIVVAYFLLSEQPYDLWALAAALVVPVGLARLGFARFVD